MNSRKMWFEEEVEGEIVRTYEDSPQMVSYHNNTAELLMPFVGVLIEDNKITREYDYYDLNTLVELPENWVLERAVDINNSGVVAVFLANPVSNESKGGILLPIEMKVTDRDDPKKKWADAKDHSSSKPIYAGESCGDMVSWKLAGTDSWTSVTFTWTAEGPGGATITGPTGAGKNEWTINDADSDTTTDWLKWKPGKWKIKVQIGSSHVEFEQEVGVRTEQYIGVGSVLGESVSDDGVALNVVSQWECPQIALTIFALGSDAVNTEGNSFFVPFEMEDRVYVNHRLFNSTTNTDPHLMIDPEKSVSEACGLDGVKHYRGFSACQYRFKVEDGKINGRPQPVSNEIADLVGFTPIPCTGGDSYGQKGEAHPDSGRLSVSSDSSEFYHLTKFRVGKSGQNGFKKINGRIIPWVFFKFRFKPDDGLLDSKVSDGASLNPDGPDSSDYSLVPTWQIYRRYFDLEQNKWNVERIERLQEAGRPFFSIGAEVQGAPYVLP